MVERFGEIDEDHVHGLALVNGSMPVVQHVDQGTRGGTLSESAVLPVVEAASDVLQYPRPDERLEQFSECGCQ